MKNKIIKISLAIFLLFQIQCAKQTANVNKEQGKLTDQQFIEKTFNIFEIVSASYPKGSIQLKINKDNNGELVALFSKINLNSKAISSANYLPKIEKQNNYYFTQNTMEEANEKTGITCDGTWECGKLLKKCLDSGCEGRIRNGACATYCVECVCY